MKVMLDTAFLINLTNKNAQFHENAVKFFERFSKEQFAIYVSTIALAEYAIRDEIVNLPLQKVRLLSFNHLHAVRAGCFGRVVSSCRKEDAGGSRAIVLNDSKMFAQASVEHIDYVASADKKASKVVTWLKQSNLVSFTYVDITDSDVNCVFPTLFLV